jgi:hypothetical protein
MVVVVVVVVVMMMISAATENSQSTDGWINFMTIFARNIYICILPIY